MDVKWCVWKRVRRQNVAAPDFFNLKLRKVHRLKDQLDEEVLNESGGTLSSGLLHVQGDEDVGVLVLALGVLQGSGDLKHGGHPGAVVVEAWRVGDRVPVSTDHQDSIRPGKKLQLDSGTYNKPFSNDCPGQWRTRDHSVIYSLISSALDNSSSGQPN